MTSRHEVRADFLLHIMNFYIDCFLWCRLLTYTLYIIILRQWMISKHEIIYSVKMLGCVYLMMNVNVFLSDSRSDSFSGQSAWWRHQIETFSALLAICAGKSPVIPRTKASDAELWCFFDLRLNKRLSKQSWGWWFERPSRPLWRHSNGADTLDAFRVLYYYCDMTLSQEF